MPDTRKKFSALVATTALLSVVVTGPAYADDTKTAAACWIDADTGASQCFASASEMQDAILAQTGAELVRQDSSAAKPAGSLALYVIADLYTGTSYTGTATSITSSSSTICSSGSVSGNLPAAANNTTSSFRSYLGCTTIIYDLFNQMGPSFGPAGNATSVGVMDNRASSYTVS